jgi:hypothetical protein|tara:strand:- start:421 stop:636 length:216 start_codon:yes stop_codon:yes gene_type:complete
MKGNFKLLHIDTVHGICPQCQEDTLLVAVVSDYYRCTSCGEDTRQYINGSIKYLKLDEKDREWLKENQSSE